MSVEVVVRLLRMRHWAKNLLVFAPAAGAHLGNMAVFRTVVLSFFAFSAVASLVYITNDLVDLERDRLHPLKRQRPLAAGDVTVAQAQVAMLLLGVTALVLVRALPSGVGVLLVAYVMANIVYMFWLKGRVVVDVILLIAFYGLRLGVGAAAVQIALTGWFIAFFGFILTSLALAKRAAELSYHQEAGTQIPGRAYSPSDREVLVTAGVAAGISAIVVLGLYISDYAVVTLYPNPGYLWAVLPMLLYWIVRFWILVERGVISDDPIDFLVSDFASYAVLVGVTASVLLASTETLLL